MFAIPLFQIVCSALTFFFCFNKFTRAAAVPNGTVTPTPTITTPPGASLVTFTFIETDPPTTILESAWIWTVLPSTGSGPAYASSCSSAWMSYDSVRKSFASGQELSFSTTVTVKTETGSRMSSSVSTTHECNDQITYESTSYGANMTTFTTPLTQTLTDFGAAGNFWTTFSAPQPTCTINPFDCRSMWSSWSSVIEEDPKGSSTSVYPPCQTVEQDCGKCTIVGGYVELMYFPVPSTSRDMCASTPSAKPIFFTTSVGTASRPLTTPPPILPQNTTSVPSTVIGNQTYYANSVYLSLAFVSAGNTCNPTLGAVHTSVLLSLPTSSLSSVRYPNLFDRAYPFNYGDLNEPVPWSAVYGAVQYYGKNSSGQTITMGDYSPQLVVPEQLRGLDDEWKDCVLDLEGLYDPPRTLRPAGVIRPPRALKEREAVPESVVTPAPRVHGVMRKRNAVPGLAFESPWAAETPAARPWKG
ncbi:hypothetical protein K402DRAFT_456419 [Aulographum hederae CBS 113979]|uniref:Uncharacterized protein n=1 Tax=Aulographum hederae CBS 113979 TaxID=1176131 RepID=A0A6G1GSC7_9PEZI|nr:hypothetical protein K402DRAFT_456419 [Aulographum hederae CBS 113979]